MSLGHELSRSIMELHIGRTLREDEVVHHKDGNPLNADISNLEVMSRSAHVSLHHKGKEVSAETRKRLHEAHKTSSYDEANRQNKIRPLGKPRSEETKQRIRESVLHTLKRKRWLEEQLCLKG